MRGRPPVRRGVGALIVALGAWLWAAPGAVAATPADLLRAFETAPALVVAEVSAVERLPHIAFAARLRVERTLRGARPGSGFIEVVWEEPAPSLPPRLVAGQRILVALDPLPTASIWKTRIPDADRRAALVAIANRGGGYIDRPSGAELDALVHYLGLDDAARRGDAGVLRLADMAVSAEPPLALAALDRLRVLPDLDRHLTPGAADALITALARADGDAVPSAVLALVEARRPEALRAPLDARLQSDIPAPTRTRMHAALGALDGEIPDAVAIALLASGSEDERLTAARYAQGPKARRKLRILVESDPSPAVRAAALTRLVGLDRAAALPEALRALDDPAAPVRGAAVSGLATLDPAAIPDLERVIESGSPRAAQAAVAALSRMGSEAHLRLAEFAREHPDEAIRTLSQIAVGIEIGHSD